MMMMMMMVLDRAEIDQDEKGAGDQDKKGVEDHDKGAEDQDKKDNENLLNDIAVMEKDRMIEESIHCTLHKAYKRTDNCTVPLYED